MVFFEGKNIALIRSWQNMIDNIDDVPDKYEVKNDIPYRNGKEITWEEYNNEYVLPTLYDMMTSGELDETAGENEASAESSEESSEEDNNSGDANQSVDETINYVTVPTKQRIWDRTTEFTAPLGQNRHKTWKHTYRTIYNFEYTQVPDNWVVTNMDLDVDTYKSTYSYPTSTEDGIYYLQYGPPTFKSRVYKFLDGVHKFNSWDTINITTIDL